MPHVTLAALNAELSDTYDKVCAAAHVQPIAPPVATKRPNNDVQGFNWDATFPDKAAATKDHNLKAIVLVRARNFHVI